MFSDAQKQALVEAGVIEPLLSLALSPDVRIQRNATGAVLNLSYSGGCCRKIVLNVRKTGDVCLLSLALSPDLRIQRNATEPVLCMYCRKILVPPEGGKATYVVLFAFPPSIHRTYRRTQRNTSHAQECIAKR